MSRNTNAEPIRGPLSPERALWAAVFEVAIRDLCRADGDKDRRDALRWLGTKDFDFIAWSLGIDADQARDRLRALAARPHADRQAHARQAFGPANPIRQAKRSLRHAA
ncbi:MAG: hypothetical protein KDJ78_00940 [Rhodobacteraceae bacterium]|uniref:hypothetical protein n=1 Tax=Amaricoccus sp. TaxID=1872485 RepID=UPI001DAA590C|nr:hypothetical protein [Amaricoccus sp.]MCB1372743.1 hypothetical protein [Paracoccaceae bacterium]MCC0067160.1 hypothetical protein [Rhodovulum sp.]HRW13858.1 hypothetical protein [Amaricoccus sp.]